MDVLKKLVGDVLASKRVKMFLGGLIGTYLVNKLGMDEELAAKFTEAIFWGVGLLIGGQTITDLASGGKTSASHPDAVAARAKAAK